MSIFTRFFELAFFLWQKLYSVADKLFYKETFFSDRSVFLWQKIRRKLFLWKKTCFCDINFFRLCVGNCFQFLCYNKLFLWQKYPFLGLFTWFSGRSLREKLKFLLSRITYVTTLLSLYVNHHQYLTQFWEKFCLLPPDTCQVSHVTRLRTFFVMFFLYKVVKLIKEWSVPKKAYPA